MRRWLIHCLLLVALVGAGGWIYRTLYPAPATVIRQQLAGLARVSSISPRESPLARAANAQKVVSFFTPDAEVILHLQEERTFNGRDELSEAALAARGVLSSLKVEFVDVEITVNPDRTSATVSLTGKATAPGEKDFFAQELAMSWRRFGPRDWRIQRVETVRTLL